MKMERTKWYQPQYSTTQTKQKEISELKLVLKDLRGQLEDHQNKTIKLEWCELSKWLSCPN